LLYTSTLCLLCLAETLGKIGTVGNDTPVPQKYDEYGYPDIARPILPEDAEAIAANRQDVQSVLHNGERKGANDVTYRVGNKEYRREDLTAYEKGEGDIGGDSHIGVMRAITVRRGQRKSTHRFFSGSYKLTPRSRNWICRLLITSHLGVTPVAFLDITLQTFWISSLTITIVGGWDSWRKQLCCQLCRL
jgi:hypothetical protein